ncbi:MAG: hypothetical protein HQL60_05580 [Magnetococcales bacterium]|nr:hypothetical protein [Magnetococcales bacterium]
MDHIDLATVASGQVITLEFGDRSAVLTKLEQPRHFAVADWFPEEQPIYLLNDAIEEGEMLYYSMEPVDTTLEEALRADRGRFGINRRIGDFLGRPVDSIEMEEEEEEESDD